MWAEQEATLTRLFEAARRNRLEFLLEIIPSKVGPVDDDTTARAHRALLRRRRLPRLVEARADDHATPPGPRPAPRSRRNDPHTRGIVVLGLDAPEAELAASFALAAGFDLVKGFAVGRTIFGDGRAGLDGRRRSTTTRPSPRWRARYARLCARLGRGAGDRAGGVA